MATVSTNPYAPRGGIDYNTTNTAGKKAITENELKLKSDPNYVKSELERTQGVISGMGANVGKAQTDYLAKLQSLAGGQPQENVMGPAPIGQPQGVPGADYIENLRKIASEGASAQAYDSRNQADAINIQNARGMQELMANKGLGSSGENITAMLNQSANRSNSLNSINNQLASDLRGIDSDSNSQLLQNLYRNQDVDFRNQSFDWQKQMDEAGLTGNLGNIRTLAGLAQDYSQMADTRNFNYGVGRDKVSDSQWLQTFNEDKRRYGEEFAYQKVRDSITDNRWKTEFDEQVRQHGLDNAVQWFNANTSRMQEGRLASSGGSDGGKPVSYKENPNFADEVTFINSNPNALSEIQANAQSLMKEYGYEGYQELLKLATPKG